MTRHLRPSIKKALTAITGTLAVLLVCVNDFNGIGSFLFLASMWAVVIGNIYILENY